MSTERSFDYGSGYTIPGEVGFVDYEPQPPKLDALIVLGKNIGVDWTARDIESVYLTHLSPHSRINVLAAGILYMAGVTDKIIFSTGKTAGNDLPSEAQAMKRYLLKIFKSIPEEAVILEDISWDTNTNAKGIRKKMREHRLKRVGLLTVGFHLERALFLFERAGILPEEIFTSEEELEDKFPRFVENYVRSELYGKEVQKEKDALALQQKVPPEFVSFATWFTRNRTLPGLVTLLS